MGPQQQYLMSVEARLKAEGELFRYRLLFFLRNAPYSLSIHSINASSNNRKPHYTIHPTNINTLRLLSVPLSILTSTFCPFHNTGNVFPIVPPGILLSNPHPPLLHYHLPILRQTPWLPPLVRPCLLPATRVFSLGLV